MSEVGREADHCPRCRGLRFMELTRGDGFKPISAGDTPEAWGRGSLVYRCGLCRGEGWVTPEQGRRVSTLVVFGSVGTRI